METPVSVIEILGPGCCYETHRVFTHVVEQAGLECLVQKNDSIERMVELGVLRTPGFVPSSWIASSVGGNGVGANLLASLVAAFMYFATLTEIPILQTLLGSGMGKGPVLALLLAGPALSLPSMIVIRSYLGTRKTVAYVSLVVPLATATGWAYGFLFA